MNEDFESPAGAFLALLVGLFLAASLWAWWRALDHLARGRPLLAYEPRREPPWGLVDLVMGFFLMMVCLSCTTWILARGFEIDLQVGLAELSPDARGIVLLGSALNTLVAFLLSVGIVHWRTGATLSDLGIDPTRFAEDMRLGLVGFVLIAPVVYGVQMLLVRWVESQHPLVELLREHPDPRFFLLSIVTAVVVAPLAEEYFFRVLLQGWLERAATSGSTLRNILLGGRGHGSSDVNDVLPNEDEPPQDVNLSPSAESAVVERLGEVPARQTAPVADSRTLVEQTAGGSIWAVLLPAILFGLAHANHGPDPIALFLLALGLGYLYQRTHRILPCIIVHFLLNASSLALLWFLVHFGEELPSESPPAP